MTLDEAIEKEKQYAESKKRQAEESNRLFVDESREKAYREDIAKEAEESRQRAAWLKELKSYRTSVFSGDMTHAMLKEEYCKAIDDFAKEFKRKTPMENKLVDEIAENLKAGDGK